VGVYTESDRLEWLVELLKVTSRSSAARTRELGTRSRAVLGAKKITVLVGARDEARGQAAVEKLKAEGAMRVSSKLDVTDHETIQRAAEWIEKEFGRLDILVNNAGIGEWGAKPSGADLAKVREVYETNLFGPVAMTQAMLPLLRKSKHGRIVNVSSSLGSLTLASQPDSPMAQFPGAGLQHVEIGAEQHDRAIRQ
jgi:NAD(P)-dependent dehydrogenase (short-subunit alcohol dehydrogenase family)